MMRLDSGSLPRRAAILLVLWALACGAQARDLAIHAGHIFDGTSRALSGPGTIIVHNDRIVAIKSGFVVPDGADPIDLSDQTVLPGLIDVHDHLASAAEGGVIGQVTLTEGDLTIQALRNARAELDQGFTAVRDVNSNGNAVIAARRAIEGGAFPGPHIFTALEALGPTGGHSDPMSGIRDGVTIRGRELTVVDGVDAAILQVREHRRRGADLIKIFPSGGILTPGDNPEALMMSPAEIAAVVETAHGLGMKVAAHAHGKAAIDASIRAGVDSIEHGTLADAESIRLMREHGTWLVPTPLVAETALASIRAHPEIFPADVRNRAERYLPRSSAVIAPAVRAGVHIAYGTDKTATGPTPKAAQFQLLVNSGMSPADAIIAATGGAAELLGQQRRLGVIEPNALADLVAIKGDPLQNVRLLEHIDFVMIGGKIYRQGDPSPAK